MRRKSCFFIVFTLLIVLFSLAKGAESAAAAPVEPTEPLAPDAATIYVRPDGDDANCDGTVDAAYPGSGGPGLACAVQTIGQGVTLVDAGGTVNVAAGTYVESVYISKTLSLVGPNAGTPGYDARASEAIIDAVDWYGVYTDQDDVTIDGIMVTGVATETYGVALYQAENLLLQNSVMSDTYMGVIFWATDLNPVYGGLIQDNYITGASHTGIHVRDNAYARIESNHVAASPVGIGVEDFTNSNPVSAPEPTVINNVLSAIQIGVRYNLHYDGNGPVTPFTVEGNDITVASGSDRPWTGIELVTLRSAFDLTIGANTIDGTGAGSRVTSGFEAKYVTGSNIVISGSMVSNTQYGLWASDGMLFTGRVENLKIENVSFNNLSEGAFFVEDIDGSVTDAPSNTADGVAIVVGTGNTHTNVPYELILAGELVTATLDGIPGFNTVKVLPGGPGTYDYPVYNVPDTYRHQRNAASINYGVDRAVAGGSVTVAAGTYNEQVTIDKSLTLQGEGAGATVLQGSDAGQGIYLPDQTQGVMIGDLTVRNYQDGIVFGTYGHVITDVVVSDVHAMTNTRHGILSNAETLTNITLTRVNASYNGTVTTWARGVFFQSSGAARNHVTIEDGVFSDNALVGIDFNIGQATDVVITGNTVENNGDAGIGVLGAFSALIDDNVVTDNGRFGIEIKNPDGDGTMSGPNRFVVSNNVVSRTGPPTTDQRDHGGIVVIRRDAVASDGNPDIPSGVVVISNTVSGYQQTISDHEGFGIVIEGTEMRAANNDLQNNDVGIQIQAGNVGYPGNSPTGGATTPETNTDYFDRGNSPVTCATVENNTYSGNAVDSRSIGAGTPSVTNIDTGETFCAIQAAIDDADTVDGHTIVASAGVYTEQVTIDKSLVVQGAGAGSSIIDGTGLGVANLVRVVNATGPVTVTGFTIQNAGNYQMTLSGGDPGATIHIADNEIICTGDDSAQDYGLYGSNGESTVLFQYNTVTDCMYHGFFLERWMGPSEVSYNDFTVGQDRWYLATATGHMTYRRTASETDPHNVSTRQWVHHNNIDANGRSGVLFISAYGTSYNDSRYADGKFTDVEISDNDIFNIGDYTKGIQLETDDDTGGFYDVLIARNTLTAQNVSDGTNTSRGIRILAGAYNTLITENTFTGFYRGLYQSYSWGEPGAVGPTGTQVLNNNFVSNTLAIDNQYITATNVIDARMNWWNDASGPGGAGPGTGDAITANVIYCPWLDAPYPSGNLASGGGLVTNQNTGEMFCAIQPAIDDADTVDGHMVVVQDGVYTGNVTVNKGITLTSSTGNHASTGTIISGTVAWSVTAPDVTIWGFRFENITSPANGIITGNSDNLTLYDNGFVNVDTAPVLCYTPGVQSGWIIDRNYINGVTGTNMSGLFLDGLANSEISDNQIANTAYAGIILANSEGIEIRDNTIYNTPRKGIQISGTPTPDPTPTIVEFNTITNTVTTDDYDEGAISLYADVENITIRGNELTDNYRGVVIRHLEAGSVSNSIWVYDNNIYNNRAASGLVDDPADYQGGVLNAAYNWWGDASGPGGEGPGTGDAITANVAYCPWLDGPYPGGSPTSDGNLVTNLDTGEMFCTIQSAIDDPYTWHGHTIVAGPGVYTETIVIDKGITLRGATYSDNKNGTTVPADYAWDPTVESIISAPNPFQDGIVVDITASNVTLEGFVIQSLYSTGSGGSGNDPHLVRVQARYNPIDNVVVQNNVIGPNTHVTLQDGTMGRMGLYLSMPNYGDDSFDITNSTFAGNKIFGCEGNGNNVFIWGGAENYNPAARGVLTGTVIEDNEIYGSHRSGIEIAGSADNLTIRDNEIYDNSGLPTDDPTALKYGNGIVIIRMGSDKTSTTAEGPTGLTITGNHIYDNEKNGIYMGPFNSGHVIASNSLLGNGWDGIRIDLEEAYHSGATPVYSATENITLHHNDLAYNIDFAAQVIGTPTNGFVLNAEDNWFGCNYGPGATGPLCTGSEGISGTIDADPWLVLDLTANPMTILDNETADLTADLTWNSDGVDTSAAGYLPDGVPASFFVSTGSASPWTTGTVSGMAHSTFTPLSDGTAVISTVVDGQTVTATVTISKSWEYVYLPLVMSNYTPMPDLQVTDITVDPASGLGTGDPVTITVTVENVGDAAAGPFWVDLYDNPDPVPTDTNQPWNELCSGSLVDCYGIAWYVSGGLAPGESVTLSSQSGYEDAQTHWLGYFVEGGSHDLYAFADTWNPGVEYGAVEERNEGIDNRFGPVTVDVAVTRSFVRPEEGDITIPLRPATP